MVDGVQKRRQSRLPKEDPRTLSQVGGDIQQGLGTVLRGAMSAGEFVVENPRLVGETLARGASYAVPGSSTAEFVGMAPELTSNELAPGVMELLREGKYGEASSLAAFLGLDLAQLSGFGTVPATLIKGGRGLAKGIGELADIAEQQRLLSIESGGPPIGGGDIPRSSVPTRKEIADIGVSMGEAKKAGNEELFQALKAQQAKMKARFDEANPKQEKVKLPTTSPKSLIRVTDNEYDPSAGSIPGSGFEVRSNVRNGIETVNLDNGTGSQFLSALQDRGVTKDELRNSGLGSFLQQNKDRIITRQDVLEDYSLYAPRIDIKEVPTRYETLQRIAEDDSENYREVIFRNLNERTGFNDDVADSSKNNLQLHYKSDNAKGQLGHARLADIDGSSIGQPGGKYELLNEYQDDFSKGRQIMDRADPKVLSKQAEKLQNISVPFAKGALLQADRRLALIDEVIEELDRVGADQKFIGGYGSVRNSLGNTRDEILRQRNSVKEQIQDPSKDFVGTPEDPEAGLFRADVLDSRVNGSNQVLRDIPLSKSIEDAGFNKDLMKRISQATSDSIDVVDKDYGLLRQNYKSAYSRWEQTANALLTTGKNRVELTPDNVRKLSSPKNVAARAEFDKADAAVREAELNKDLGNLEGKRYLEDRQETHKKDIEFADRKLVELPAEIAKYKEQIKEAERLGGPTAQLRSLLTITEDALKTNRTKLKNAKEQFAKNETVLRDYDAKTKAAREILETRQSERGVVRDRLRSEGADLVIRAMESGTIPGRVGSSKEQHRLILETLIEQSINNPRLSGFVVPSPRAIDTQRGEGEEAFQFLYGDLVSSVAEKMKKRYPGLEVIKRNTGGSDDLSDALVIKFPKDRQATEPLVHRYAQGGLVMKGIGSMGKEVL